MGLNVNIAFWIGVICIGIPLVQVPMSQKAAADAKAQQAQSNERQAAACTWIEAKAPILVNSGNQPISITNGRIYTGAADSQGNGQILASGLVIRSLDGTVAKINEQGQAIVQGVCPKLASLPEYREGHTTMQRQLGE
ncbi:MAG: hypothetical protein ACRC62_15380 [Microcoleus sp.]